MRNQLLGGRYRILDQIGEGGMAFVYLALDEKLGRKVAVKILHEHMERNADIRQRFQMEAQAVSSLDHPNIVKVYDFSGDQVGRLWIVTEVIHGRNLAQYVQQSSGGWLHPVIAAAIVNEICKALEMAHNHGIVHRDVKPENIMMTFDGRVKLMDFGIAKDLGKSGMTVTGTFMGSPSYMSPEQIRGRDIDLRSDLYSLSILFYEVVAGRLPFAGATTHDVVLKIMEGKFTHPRFLVPGLPLALDEIIVKNMSKNPSSRCQTAKEYAANITQVLQGLGFDESHIELERFFKDREGYSARLAGAKTGAAMAMNSYQTNTNRGKALPATAVRSMVQQSPHLQPFRTPTQKIETGKGDGGIVSLKTKHLTQFDASPPAQPRNIAPPPIPSAQEKLAVFAPPPPRQATAYLTPQGVAIPLRHLPRQVRRSTRQPSAVSATNWIGYIFASLLVGLTCAVGLWGFLNLNNRPATKSRPTSNAEAAWRESVRASVRLARKAVRTRRDGSAATGQVGTGKAVAKTATAALPANRSKTPRGADQTNGLANTSQSQLKAATTNPPANFKAPNITKKIAKHAEPKDNSLGSSLGSGLANLAVSPATSSLTKTPALAPAKLPTALVSERLDAPAPEPAAEPGEDRTPQRRPKAEKLPKVDKVEAADKGEKGDQGDHTVRSEPKDRDDRSEPKERSERNDKPTKKDAVLPGNGRFSISSQPAAEVYVDGRRMGTSVDNTSDSGWLTVSAGRHALELRRKDYATARSRFEVTVGEQKALPRIILEPGAQGNQGKPKPTTQDVQLTLRINYGPAQVTIRNLDSNASQIFTMAGGAKTISLSPGRHHIRLDHSGETKERDLTLNGNEGHLTFSIEFKNAD